MRKEDAVIRHILSPPPPPPKKKTKTKKKKRKEKTVHTYTVDCLYIDGDGENY